MFNSSVQITTLWTSISLLVKYVVMRAIKYLLGSDIESKHKIYIEVKIKP